MAMKIVEIRSLHMSTLRDVCIDHGWYTCGDNASYDRFLLKVGGEKNLTPDDLLDLAQDIYRHTSPSCFNVGTKEAIEHIMFVLAYSATSYFELEEEIENDSVRDFLCA